MIIKCLILILIIFLIGVMLDIGGIYLSSYFADNGDVKASKVFYIVMIIGEWITNHLLLIAIFIIVLRVNG